MPRASAIDHAFDVADGSRTPFEFSAFASAYLNVMRAIQERAGLILLLGAPGGGKTTLLRTIQDALPRKRGRAIFRSRPGDGLDELLKTLLSDLRVTAISPGRDDRLEALAASIERRSAPTVLLVDDAHHVPNKTISALAALSMHRHGEAAGLQVVLSGEPQLEERLQQPALAWIADHITSRVPLDPLGDDEIGRYIVHRLANAPRAFPWTKGAANPFAPEAVNQVLRYSHGVPATVNRLCQSALSGGAPRVDAAQIHRAAVKCGLSVVATSAEAAPVKAAAEPLPPPTPPPPPEDVVVAPEEPIRQRRLPQPRAGYGIVLVSIAAGLAAALAYQTTSLQDFVSHIRPAGSNPMETPGKAHVTWVQIAPIEPETSAAAPGEARIPVARAAVPDERESAFAEPARPVVIRIVDDTPAATSDIGHVAAAPASEPQILPAPTPVDDPPPSPRGPPLDHAASLIAANTAQSPIGAGSAEPPSVTLEAPAAEKAPSVIGAIAALETPAPSDKGIGGTAGAGAPTAEAREPITSPDPQVAEAPPPEPALSKDSASGPGREDAASSLAAQVLPHVWPGPVRVEGALAPSPPSVPPPTPSTDPVPIAQSAIVVPESVTMPPDPPRTPTEIVPAVQKSPRAELNGAPSLPDTSPVADVRGPTASSAPVSDQPARAVASLTAPERAPPRTDERVAARPAEPAHVAAQPSPQPHKPVQAVASPSAAAAPATAAPAVEMLLARGRALLESGDPASARLFFERAAAQGHAGAMAAVAQTFDPIELQRYGLIGPKGDPQRALDLYRRAAAAGDTQSQERIGRLEQWVASHPPPR